MQTAMEKASYAIGQNIGNDFKRQGLDINVDIMTASIKSAFNGEESLLTPEETDSAMMFFQEQLQEKFAEQKNAVGNINLEEGKKFLEENAKQADIIVTKSGLQYKIIEEGSGKTPSENDTVEVHYEGKLTDGTVFDSSIQRGQSISFPVNGVIKGWTEALQLMKEGSKYQLCIPADLAYGAQGAGGVIGPNATLIFDVELLNVR